MNTQKCLEEIIRNLRSLANRLEYELNNEDTSLQGKVEEFLRDIPQTVANLHLNLLVRQLMREQKKGEYIGRLE